MTPKYSYIYVIFLSLGVFLTGCSQRAISIQQSLQAQSMQAPEVSPILLAAYQPWFGKPSHIDVGYSSLDRVTQQKQI
jgi:hypothetical protein